jgi:WD40 repeat protein
LNRLSAHLLRLIVVVLLAFTTLHSNYAAQRDREILRLGRGTANALDWRPDGKVLAVGGSVGVWLYDENFITLGKFAENVSADWIKWSSSGEELAVAADHKSLQIWKVDDDYSGTLLTSLNVGDISSIAWNPQGTLLAISFWSSEVIRLWDMIEKEFSQEIPNASWSVAWSPDGKKLAGISQDNSLIQIWDAESGDLQTILNGVQNDLFWTSVAWSPDGVQVAAVSSLPASLHIWSVQSGKLINSPDTSSDMYMLHDLLWSKDGKQIISTGRSPSPPVYADLWIWNESKWDDSIRGGGLAGGFRSISFTPDQRRLSAVTSDSVIATLDAFTGDLLETHNLHDAAPRLLAFSPDNIHFAVFSGYDEGRIKIWGLENTTETTNLEPIVISVVDVENITWTNRNEFVTTILRIGNGSILFSVVKWNSVSGNETDNIFNFSADWFPAISVNSDFSQFALTNYERDKVEIRDIATDEILHTLKVNNLNEIKWSPDNKAIAITTGREIGKSTLAIWKSDGSTSQPIQFETVINIVHWSPDSKNLAILERYKDKSSLNILDAESGSVLATFDVSGNVAWSPNSRYLAIGSFDDGNLFLWNVSTSSIIAVGSANGITALAFSPDSTMLALGMDGGTIRIWDVADLLSS